MNIPEKNKEHCRTNPSMCLFQFPIALEYQIQSNVKRFNIMLKIKIIRLSYSWIFMKNNRN